MLKKLAPRIWMQVKVLFTLSLLFLSLFLPYFTRHAAAASPWLAAGEPAISSGNTISKEEFDKLRSAKLGPYAGRSCTQKRIARRAFGSLNIQYENACWYNTKIGLLSDGTNYLLQPGTEVAGHLGDSSPTQPIFFPTPNDDVFLELTPALSVGYGYYIGFRHVNDFELERITHSSGTVTLNTTKSATSIPRNGVTNKRLLAATPLAWSADGQYAILGLSNGTVYRFNLETFKILTTEAWTYYGTPFAGSAAVSPSGKYGALTKEQYSNGSDLFVIDFESCKGGEQDKSVVDKTCEKKSMRSTIAKSISPFSAPLFPRFFGEYTIGFFHRSATDSNAYQQYFLQAAGVENTFNSYVALGDSYSSGEGAGHYIVGTDEPFGNVCHTSEKSYPYVINNRLDLTGFVSFACSGAMIKHFTSEAQYKDDLGYGPGDQTQRNLLSESMVAPNFVTLSLSGNDIGFGEKLKYCLGTPRCYDSYEERIQIAEEITQQHSRLVSEVYSVINTDTRDANIYILGYPKIFDDSDTASCGLNVRFNAYQRKMANDLIVYFNAVIKSAAEHAGAFYVDVGDTMTNHRLCEGPSATMAFNGLTMGNDTPIFPPVISNGSYHPNVLGHELFADTILTQTNNFTAAMPDPVKNPIPGVDGFDFSDVPKRGYPIRQLYHDPSENPILGIKGQDLDISITDSSLPLSPFTEYQAEIHSDPIPLGTVSTNGAGMITATLPLPSDTPTGIHELHIVGTGDDGQPIDIYRLVYVGASTEDFDGDGIPNQDELCGIIEPAFVDTDQDNIDDGCDPIIGPAPAQEEQNGEEPFEEVDEEATDPAEGDHKDTAAVLADQAAKDEFIQNNITRNTLTNTGTASKSVMLPLLASCLLLAISLVLTVFDRLRYAKR